LNYEFKPSFDRSIKSLQHKEKADIKAVCLSFLDFLEASAHLPAGIGLKHLRDDYWEIRKDLRCRILFRWQHDVIEFVLAGDHDSIKYFLKDY
jgi:mRNA-degrading endonuclease RelE of RelBE toxin-antitoxin system